MTLGRHYWPWKTCDVARTLSRSEVAKLAGSIRSLLQAIRTGDLEADSPTTYRLEGALVTLQGVLGRTENALDALMDPDPQGEFSS